MRPTLPPPHLVRPADEPALTLVLAHSLIRIGVLDEQRMRLDYVLALKVEDFLERRLQTQVFKSGLAKSIHHARVLIRQRHIRCVPRRPCAAEQSELRRRS